MTNSKNIEALFERLTIACVCYSLYILINKLWQVKALIDLEIVNLLSQGLYVGLLNWLLSLIFSSTWSETHDSYTTNTNSISPSA